MASEASQGNFEVSVVLPCLNEADTVGTCVTTAIETLQRLGIPGEVVVVDNGSDDRSPEIARSAGARVVLEPRRGYGNALRRGAEEARAPLIVMADSDDSYDLSDLGRFVDELRAGADLVIGSRQTGHYRAGCDALVAPSNRQSAALGNSQSVVQGPGLRRPLRDAGLDQGRLPQNEGVVYRAWNSPPRW